MLNSISGKVAVITGASRGIGRSIAQALAQEGCNVALLARNENGLKDTAQVCTQFGVKTLCLPLDITNTTKLESAIQQAAITLGGIDFLINNAGVASLTSALNANSADWKRLLDVNLHAAMEATRITLPYIVQRGGGAIIFIASISAKITYPGGAAYCASKHAISGFAGAVFDDVRHHNIKVCTICPGYVNTEMIAALGLDATTITQPEDIAEAVRFVVRFPNSSCPTEIIIKSQKSPYI